jgi:hypothetical protein
MFSGLPPKADFPILELTPAVSSSRMPPSRARRSPRSFAPVRGPVYVSPASPSGGACKSMNHAQKYLAQANRQIAELTVQIVGQRVIVKHALDTDQRSEMADSLLDALEGSLHLFEKHRIFLLSLQRIIQRPAAG